MPRLLVTVFSSPPPVVRSYLSSRVGKIHKTPLITSLALLPKIAASIHAMASLTNTTALHVSQTFRRRCSSAVSPPRSSFRCQSRLPTDPIGGGGGGGGGKKRAWWVAMAERVHGGVVKAGRAVQENLSPKQKGDWKDVALMSLSFAVYVYISEKIVCTYCAYVSMIHHH